MTLHEDGNSLSPYLLLVHHCHSFLPFDPVRAITKLLLPEGFPAHPHSGFSTVTYCIEGGLCHRDSEGQSMTYGDGDAQWMRAGRGTIHEEMWNLKPFKHIFKRIEIFQLWINLPSKFKTLPPFVARLKNEDIPVYSSCNKDITIKIIAGSIQIDDSNVLVGPGNEVTSSPSGIYHLSCQPNTEGVLSIPPHCTVALYIRRGSVILAKNAEVFRAVRDDQSEEVGSCNLLEFKISTQPSENQGGGGSGDDMNQEWLSFSDLSLLSGSSGLDGLLLVGAPLNEPVIWRGPLVQSTPQDFQSSANVFNSIGAGAYWDYNLSNAEWTKQCKQVNLQDVISRMRDLE
ncbi:unnamed protein product [Sphagnum jensenii]|uniref:Pirin N-terminal domain-containing protein n=1 Tax=Sphagnum jensenii TaxID=128206 RepID=A0ABP0VB36_9BRYO